MIMSPNNAEAIVLGTVALHNFLRREVGLHCIGPKSTDYETSRGDCRPGQRTAEGVGKATCCANGMVNDELLQRLQCETLSRRTFAVKAGPFPGKKP